ncbi:lipopolysaccharide export system protein LptC [Shewanella colwelliana]|uniref:Lipopolysaccharide export system protein LptC n=1 Tax=Shewanella colwelliana TaxID=23 RepID=A0A1E5IRS5_SHECO|nr:LPS export ABC transporter periplasmic protein LptC [Shewanella colwelliana]MDX1280021.1 LPS export ABC transporter periplasmic protein LptC [Shewanella colwelliana]OEG73282.1 LPS export ABC transporter periplasmic protein LptC [Shewanella colwelliana]GIU23857.1 lipopolysaccharide export system protein LptC [Shewanella colwelliana]GIU38852.1 lipopolysaccharide export system protein LptC [Shewanella colwelliana]
MNRVTLAIIAFFGTALILYWQVQTKRGNEALNIDVTDRPDYVINDLKSVQYNELGQLNSRVSASHMEHYSDKNMTYFTQPVYLVYPDEGNAQWRLRSTKGTLDKASGRVKLENNVIIDAISPEEPIQTIETTYLELDLNTMIMTSDRTIRITGNDFLITGKGLYADLNAQNVRLTSQVEGTYETK